MFKWVLVTNIRFFIRLKTKGYRTVADFLSQSWRFFCRGFNQVKICRDISLPHTSRFLSRLTSFSLGAESISAMFEKRLVHVTLMTIPHWLRYARARTNCLDLPHTSRQGPTRRVAIQHCQISPDKPRFCGRLVWIHCTLADKWRFFGGRQKIS